MKRCLKSAEPTCLVQIRATEPDANWDDFRDQHPSCYDTIRGILWSDQSGLCAYCERLLPDQDRQVAHFHPKSDTAGGDNWALRWDNLWLACQGGTRRHSSNAAISLEPLKENRSCDEAKENHIVDGKVLSPAQIPAFPPVFAYSQSTNSMSLVPNDDSFQETGISIETIQNTIDVFNLNCRRLAEARMRVHAEIEKTIKKISAYPDKKRAVTMFKQFASEKLQRVDGSLPEFFTMKRWRFRDTAEDYLHAISYQG